MWALHDTNLGVFGKEGFLCFVFGALFDFCSERERESSAFRGFSKTVIMLSSVFGFEQKFCWWQDGTENETFTARNGKMRKGK